jgi:hypothetical protein
MLAPLPLRAALLRGALVALANWPIVLIEFAIESLYKLALIVPVVGGALMAVALAGGSMRAIFEDGVRVAAGLILSALTDAPVAFVSFVLALLLVGVGGSLVMFYVKAGTLGVLISGERQGGIVEREPFGFPTLAGAARYGIDPLVAGIRRFGRRMLVVGVWLSAAYVIVGIVYLTTLAIAFRWSDRPGLSWAWPLVIVIATAGGIVALAMVNVVFDLLRVILVAEDCGVRTAVARLSSFLVVDARQVVGIFFVVTALFALAAAASILVAAGLALVAWVPVVGLIVVPLQAAAWLVRGLVFQYMSITALAAYATQYRRFEA